MLNFDWISHIDIAQAKLIVLLTFIIPFAFALTLKKSYIYAGAKDQRLWRNLKIWVAILSILMIIVYSSF